MGTLPKASRYKIMSACITPRPIAWVTSLAIDGTPNAAPFSFFNMMGDDPPTIVLGFLERPGLGLKDSAANIRATGEFVINLVDQANAETMNRTCIDAPPEISEIDFAGLETARSVKVAPPRIATAPASFECRTLHAIETGRNQLVIIGEVLQVCVRDAFILDREQLHIDTPAMDLIARLHGAGWYSRQTDLFQMTRPTWAEHLSSQEK